jgi:hypothetical protein
MPHAAALHSIGTFTAVFGASSAWCSFTNFWYFLLGGSRTRTVPFRLTGGATRVQIPTTADYYPLSEVWTVRERDLNPSWRRA